MSAEQQYYEQILSMGHTPESALTYTRQHYPDFIPGEAESIPAPVSEPISQQAIPAQQPVMEAPVTATPAPVPAAVAPMNTGIPPNAYTPMNIPVPASGVTTPMMWAAIGCIVVALLLSVMGQFSHSWIVSNDTEGATFGLTSAQIDCSFSEGDTEFNISKQQAIDSCKVMAYQMYSEDMAEAAAENKTASDLDDVIIGDMTHVCKNVYDVGEIFAMGNETVLDELDENKDECLETPAAGSTGGMILWVGTLGALLGAVMLGAGAMGQNLPANAEKYGKWTGMAAGGLMLLAVLVWWVLLPDTDADTSAGMGVWMTVLGGLLGVAAGILAFLDQK